MDELLLGIDLGTGGCKITLINQKGRFVAENTLEYKTYHPSPGWSEQNPAEWYSTFGACIGGLLNTHKIDSRHIVAMAVDASTHNAVLLDENMRVIRKCIMWNDQRSFKEVDWLKENYGDFLFDVTYQKPSPTWTLPQLLWVKNNEPESFARIRHIMFTKDYLRYILTGVWCTDWVDAAGTMLLDFARKEWSGKICDILGLSPAVLPEIRLCTDPAGKLLPEKAQALGLREGTPVITGASDTASEDFGAGAIRAGQCIVKLATAGNVNVFTEKPTPTPYSFTYPHVVPGMFYTTMGTNAAAASMRWFRDAITRGATYPEIDALACQVPPGSENVFFHPYLSGERSPYFDPHLRASFIGVSAFHHIGHFARAVMEGVAFSLKDCFMTVRKLGLIPDEVRLIGGGAKSPLWAQIVADVFNLEVVKLQKDDSSLGSAMLAGIGVGIFSGFAEASEKATVVDKVYKPDPENTAVYERQFSFYKKFHDISAPFYKDLYFK